MATAPEAEAEAEVCDGVDNDLDGEVDGFELYCCSWSTGYVGRCVDGRVAGCGWCLELDGQPGLGFGGPLAVGGEPCSAHWECQVGLACSDDAACE